MNSKILFSISIAFLLTLSSPAFATNGVVLAPGDVGTSGPLINTVTLVPSCDGDASCMKTELITGHSQGVEFSFSQAFYTDLLTLAPAAGCTSTCSGDIIDTPSWFGLLFNDAKFPGIDLHFRRAMAFIQNYTYLQLSILGGAEGTASSDIYQCPPDPVLACNPGTWTYPTSMTNAGKELEEIDGTYSEPVPDGTSHHLFCTNAGVACAGTYGGASTWCLGAADANGDGICNDANTAFFPYLHGRTTHHRKPWALKMVADMATIGVSISNANTGGGGAQATCFVPNAAEVTSPGVYQTSGPLTFYNSVPSYSGAGIAADTCDMYTFGFIGTTPSVLGIAQTLNSQFAGTTGNSGNFYDSPTYVTPADAACGACASGAHATTSNVDYNSNKILYASSLASAYTAAQDLQDSATAWLPTIPGFYETTLWVVNVDGWTGYAGVASVGPTELGGIYWTLMDAHQCGSVTCAMGAVNGGTLGGNFNYTLQFGADGGMGFNPVYDGNWVWQANVINELYDAPLAIGPTQFDSINAFTDYMTTLHTDTPAFSGTTGVGGTWFYFQQPCSHGLVTIPMCQGKAGPEQAPGPKQHGTGLTVAQRTIINGEKIVLTFRNDIYFADGQQLTAKDLVATIDYLNAASSPNYPDSASPASGVVGGQYGLLASHIVPGTKNLGVEFYFGATSVWNLANIQAGIMPGHVLKYLNHDKAGSIADCPSDAAYLSEPFGDAALTCTDLTTGTFALSATSYINYQPNINFGSGPFTLNCDGVSHNPAKSCWSDIGETGQLIASPSYFNRNWTADARFNIAPGATYTFSIPHMVPIYNPTGSTITCGPSSPGTILAGTWGSCQLMAPWAATGLGTVKVYDSSGNLVRSLKLAKNIITGLYTVSIPLTQAKVIGGAACATFTIGVCFPLASGDYKVVIQSKFTFKPPGTLSTGAAVWYQVSGFNIP